MTEGNRLVIDGEPGVVLGCKEIPLLIEVKDRVEAEVDVAVAVVIEEVVLQALDQIPLLFRQGDALLAGLVGGPHQPGRVKAVVGDVSGRLLVV